jgi:hypothetical protein
VNSQQAKEGYSMQILVDADACPVKEIIVRIAKRQNIPVTMVTDTSHELHDGHSTIVTVDKGRDSVDFALINMVQRDDVVVTQDYGVAAMALGKGAKALNQNGLVYTDENIGKLLSERHIGQKIRRGGGRTKGPRKRTSEDDEQFKRAFLSLVMQS